VSTADVVIVGAGPYGLSAAAHLKSIKGLDVRVHGEPMSFWERHMPRGMLLRSPYVASHLSDPERALTLDTYQQECGRVQRPVPLDRFVDYGRWFQRKVAPDLDTRQVVRVEKGPSGLTVALADGERIKTRRVVVAAGIGLFARYPDVFRDLPSSLVSHASAHRDLGQFDGKHVLVIGAGQSALESTALLRESGARVEIVVRQKMVHWLWRQKWMHKPPFSALLYAPPDVGPAGVSHLTARPHLYRMMPREWQDRLGVRCIRPAGAAWLAPRVNGTPIHTDCCVTAAVPVNGRLRVTLSDGEERLVDHVLLGTGYQVDARRFPFLAPEVLAAMRHSDGYPHLDGGFETTVRGLHFVGAPAAWSYGPLMRFVAGVDFASRALQRRVQVRP